MKQIAKSGLAALIVSSVAGCGISDAGNQTTKTQPGDAASVAGERSADRQKLRYVSLSSLLEIYDETRKGEFETSDAHRNRLGQLNSRYRARNPFVTVIPVTPYRWTYDADNAKISYNTKAIGSLLAATEIQSRNRQAWVAQDDVDFGIGVNRLVVTQPCAATFPADETLGRALKAKDARYFFALTLTVPTMSEAVMSHSYQEPMNTKTTDWGVQQLEASVLNVELISDDGKVVVSKKC